MKIRITDAEKKSLKIIPNLREGLKGGISYSNTPIKSLQDAVKDLKDRKQGKKDAE